MVKPHGVASGTDKMQNVLSRLMNDKEFEDKLRALVEETLSNGGSLMIDEEQIKQEDGIKIAGQNQTQDVE